MNARLDALGWVAYAVVAVVGATVLAVSAYYLWRLAVLARMPVELAWTLPVALDAGAIGATVCWVSAHDVDTRRWGRGIALSALAATVAGNVLSHLIDYGLMVVSPALVIGLGAVYPAVLWAMVHLALVLRAGQRDRADVAPAHSTAEQQAPRVEVEAGQAPPGPAWPRHESDPDRDATRQADGDASLTGHRAEPLTRRPGTPTASPTTSSGASRGRQVTRRTSTAQRRQAWIDARLDAGFDVTGADVKHEFPDAANGAREVKAVKDRRERQRHGLHAVKEA